MRRFKRWLVGILILFAAFAVYVEIVNSNSKSMTYRQKVLKAIYPLWMWWGKISNKSDAETSGLKKPAVSFYTLKGVLNNGQPFDFSVGKGKKIMIVNTASNCGYTNQYEDLQELAEKFDDKLLVVAFPANDFKDQEAGTDAEIGEFCRKNFGVSFPLMQKSSVIPSSKQHPVYQWLTDSTKNGWNSKAPSWNFSKYLINEKGILTHYFGPTVSPLSAKVIEAINQ